MQMNKTPMPEQDPRVRAHNFEEVATGYTAEMAIQEAQRCLDCRHKPCVEGCPVNVKIPDFIRLLKKGDARAAYDVIRQDNALPAICGRVCPQETQCEARCVRGVRGEPVGIGRLERYAADTAMAEEAADEAKVNAENAKAHVAVVGSGPAGLSCAGELNRMGYDVTIFEALHTPGGVLVYGIPEFRLPKQLVRREIDGLERAGVKIVTNAVIGKSITLNELLEEEGFSAAFVGSGAGLPRFQNIEGEQLSGVYSANEFLTRVNLMKAYRFPEYLTPVRAGRRVAVVGGGNVAMDAARTALRLGAEEVSVVYRRSMEELPARREEVEHAEEEGVVFRLLCNPTEILGYHNPDDRRDPKNGFVTGIRCIRMELGEPDEKGRRRPVEVPCSEFTLDVDCVIMAIGTSPNPLIKSTTTGLEVNRHGGIVVQEETGATSRAGVFAGGDAVTGAATVILAMGAGKTAARAIDAYLNPAASPTGQTI